MTIEKRIETLTVALMDLTETVRDLQQQMANGQGAQEQTSTASTEEEKPKVAKAAKKPAKKEPDAQAEPDPEAEQPSGITHDQLQSECIKKVRETGGDWFKFKLQDLLRERGVKTISQLPADALEPVHKALFEEDK